MDNTMRDLLYNVTQQFVGYLPSLLAGLVLIAIGWFLGWLVKRVVVQMCVVLHLERLVIRFQWGKGLSKADLRHAFFNSIGSIFGFAVFLVFLHASLEALRLTVLSNLLANAVLFVPRFITSLVIFVLGWIISAWSSFAIQSALTREEIPRATLIGRFTKAVLLLFFSAMALTELDIAREIVIIGFAATIITLGALTIILVSHGRKSLVKKMLAQLEEE